MSENSKDEEPKGGVTDSNASFANLHVQTILLAGKWQLSRKKLTTASPNLRFADPIHLEFAGFSSSRIDSDAFRQILSIEGSPKSSIRAHLIAESILVKMQD